MIKRKYGAINKLVYDNTVYHNGDYHFYLPLDSLYGLLNLIIEAKTTTKCLYLMPFYISVYPTNRQIEFEEMMFYVECRENVTEDQKKEFLKDCCDRGHDVDKDVLNRHALCDCNDVTDFQNAIIRYSEYLKQLVPRMQEIILRDYDIGVENLLFGHICFEIFSE